MMKRRFKKVMSYFFNFDSIKTPKKKSRKGQAASSSREHLESESQYVIKRLNEGSLTPRDNVSFSRYTPLPRIGEATGNTQQQHHHSDTSQVDTPAPAAHVITYKFSPVQVREKVSYQLLPLPVSSHKVTSVVRTPVDGKMTESHSTPRLKRQDTYIVTDPVVIKGTLLEYLRTQDTMVTTRIRPPEKKLRSTSKRTPTSSESSISKPKRTVAKVSNSKERLIDIKAKLKRQQKDMKEKEGQTSFWLEL